MNYEFWVLTFPKDKQKIGVYEIERNCCDKKFWRGIESCGHYFETKNQASMFKKSLDKKNKLRPGESKVEKVQFKII